MSILPRFVESEFGPLFRLLDDYGNHVATRSARPGFSSTMRGWSPRFDVKETKEAYELHGELPGVEQKNVDISLHDNVLTIKGHTEHRHEEGARPAGFVEGDGEGEQARITEGENGYHKPTVEEDTAMAGANPETKKTGQQSTSVTQQQPQQHQQPQSQSRYWVMERSTGDFTRTFSFPTSVKEDAIKASLKNGILSVIVPKAQPPAAKRIQVE